MRNAFTDAAEAGLAAKSIGIAGVFSAGVLGAILLAAVDTPKTKREMFVRALVAGVSSLFFGPAVCLWLFRWTGIDAHVMPVYELIAWVAPVLLVTGALSWSLWGALAMFAKRLKSQGAGWLASRFGLHSDEDKKD